MLMILQDLVEGQEKTQADDDTDDTSRPLGRPSKYTKTGDNFWRIKTPSNS